MQSESEKPKNNDLATSWIRKFTSGVFSFIAVLLPIGAILYIFWQINDSNNRVGLYVVLGFWLTAPAVLAISIAREVLIGMSSEVKSIADAGSNALATRYVTAHYLKSFVGLAIASFSSALYFLIENDTLILIVPPLYAVIFFSYNLLLRYRARHGYLGGSFTEVEELTSYLFEPQSGIPPRDGAKRLHGAVAPLRDTSIVVSNGLPQGK